jgi:hypothetical protein
MLCISINLILGDLAAAQALPGVSQQHAAAHTTHQFPSALLTCCAPTFTGIIIYISSLVTSSFCCRMLLYSRAERQALHMQHIENPVRCCPAVVLLPQAS